jgi:hypothetical protein
MCQESPARICFSSAARTIDQWFPRSAERLWMSPVEPAKKFGHKNVCVHPPPAVDRSGFLPPPGWQRRPDHLRHRH